MNDRELLELAAKAAINTGLNMECPDDDDGIYIDRSLERSGRTWNPLTDDGDALRLAHALGMQLNLDECNDMNDVRTDIVMAAAAIGAAL